MSASDLTPADVAPHRRRLGLSQTALAHEADVSLSTIQAAEQGRPVSARTLAMIGAALDRIDSERHRDDEIALELRQIRSLLEKVLGELRRL